MRLDRNPRCSDPGILAREGWERTDPFVESVRKASPVGRAVAYPSPVFGSGTRGSHPARREGGGSLGTPQDAGRVRYQQKVLDDTNLPEACRAYARERLNLYRAKKPYRQA